MTLNSRLTHNTFTLLISSAGSAVFSFVLTVLIGRALGEDGLGAYATVLAWIFPLSLMVEFGLGTLITRDVAQNTDYGPAYLRATTIVRLIIGGSVALLIVIFAPVMSNNAATVEGLRISAPIIIILPMFGMFTALFRAHQVMWPIPILNIGMLVIQVALIAIVFANGGGVKAALIVNTTTSMGQLLLTWGIWRWRFDRRKAGMIREPSLQERIDIMLLLKRAWPFAIAAFIGALQLRVGIILVEQLAGTGEAGLFAAASRFVEAARMLPNAFFGALFPALATIAANPTRMRKLFKRAAIGLAAFSIIAAIVTQILSPIGIDLILGDQFSESIPILQILMWSMLPALLRGSRTLYWYALEREQYVNLINLFSIVLQIIFSLWLIPTYNAIGAAVAIILTELVTLTLLWREINVPVLRRLHYERH